MRGLKPFGWTVILLAVLAIFACGNESNEGNYASYDNYASYEDDNYAAYEDENYASYDDEYAMLPEDCYEDEEYDEEDQMCYPIYECEGDECEAIDEAFYTLVDELLGEYISGEEDFSEETGGMVESAIITYQVQGNKIVNPERGAITDDLQAYQDDAAAHQRIWVFFANLIPAEHRSYISQFVIYTDGPDEVLAAVEPDPNNTSQWILSVDIVDAADVEELTYTLVHEFAHILTLNETQVAFDEELFLQDDEEQYQEAEASCPTYFPGEGCSLGNSYINTFFDQFWVDVYDEWLESDPDSDEFYLDHEDEFVTDYAATNPAEDIAETFTLFVLQPKPSGDTIAEEKILFFYDYPELVQLRAEIAGRAFARLRR